MISYKKYFFIFLRNTLDKGFKLCRNVYQMIIYNFSIDTMLGKSRFLDLTAVNMRKMLFLIKKITFFLICLSQSNFSDALRPLQQFFFWFTYLSQISAEDFSLFLFLSTIYETHNHLLAYSSYYPGT